MAIQGFGNGNFESIRAFETKSGIKLPNDYIEFLLRYNGCNVDLTDENSLLVEGLGESVNVDVLFGINTEEEELSIELWLNDYKNDMPESTIIIGVSYQHGLIILICSGENAGVYYWDHAYEFAGSNDEMNTYFISDTFTEFMRAFSS